LIDFEPENSSPVTPPATPASRGRKLLLIGGGVVAAVIVGLGLTYAVAYAAVGSGVLPGTKVDGVSIGRLSTAAAEKKLTTALGPKANAPIKVLAGDQPETIDPATAGLTLDLRATLSAGQRRSASPFKLIGQAYGSHQLLLKTAVDKAKLATAIAAVDAEIHGGGHDGGITFEGINPVVTAPKVGAGLLRDKAAAAVQAGYLTTSKPISLPVGLVQPKISEAVVTKVLASIAKPAVAAPITMIAGSAQIEIPPSVIANNLTFKVDGSTLQPIVNGAGVIVDLGSAASGLEGAGTPAKDASFSFTNGAPVVTPGVPGTAADLSHLGSEITAVLGEPAPRQFVVPTNITQPKVTTADIENLGIKEMVSTFTTHHPCCASRVTNIHTIANIVNGHIIMPGETFSLNAFVGMRDTKRGFVEAPEINDGLYENSVGGGVSQFATTLYNAVFFAGLKDVEHHPHSYYISRYPAGREATVSWPAPNLIFTNDEPTAIYIQTSYTGTSLTVTFWGTKYYDVASTSSARYAPTTTGTVYNARPDCEASSGEPGFSIDVTQTLSQNGVVVKTNVLHTRYDPEPIIICGPSPSPDVSGSPVGSGTTVPGSTPSPSAGPSVTPTPKPTPRP
jgi:vancomycin resistance protein YoaR